MVKSRRTEIAEIKAQLRHIQKAMMLPLVGWLDPVTHQYFYPPTLSDLIALEKCLIAKLDRLSVPPW